MGRRLARIVGWLVVLPTAVGAVLALVLMAVMSGVRFPSLSFTSRGPKPIAISPATCPYLQAVQTTGDAAAVASMSLMDTRTTLAKVDYPTGYAAQLAAFDLSLRVAATEEPGPLRRKLKEVAANVEVGRILVRTTPDPTTYSTRMLDPLSRGSNALSYAKDLVGDQCRFSLSDYAF